MSVLHVFRDPPLDGPTNMARDEHLLHSERFRPAAVRIYGWSSPTISLGCFQQYARLSELPEEVRGLAVVRRPTGGGAILHDREITYCLVVDDSLPLARKAPVELYRLVHAIWRDVLAIDGLRSDLAPEDFPFPSPRSGPFFCFEKPGRTDLIISEAKLLGSAQRRIPGRVLQHGSLLLGKRYAAHPGADLGQIDPSTCRAWGDAFVRRLADELSLTPQQAEWTSDQDADIARRRRRYADDAWTRRR